MHAFLAAVLLAAGLLSSTRAPAQMHHEVQLDVVRLQAEASRDVDNDQMLVVLVAQAEGQNPADLAAVVNRRMSEALKAANATNGVRARSGNYQTQLAMRLSPQARRSAEDQLVAEAIGAFHARAEVVRQAMKASGYRIRELSVGTSPTPGPRPMAMMAERAAPAPVAVEPGQSQITVTAAGAIQLERK